MLSREQLLRTFFVLCVLSGCAHQEEVTVPLNHIKFAAPEFLTFTAADVRTLKKSTAQGAKPTTIKGKKGAEARYQEGKATYVSQGGTLEIHLNAEEIQQIVGLHRKATLENKEQKENHGPITLRCAPEKCAVDLYMDSNMEQDIKAQVNYDYSSAFLGAFIKGAVIGAGN